MKSILTVGGHPQNQTRKYKRYTMSCQVKGLDRWADNIVYNAREMFHEELTIHFGSLSGIDREEVMAYASKSCDG